jgi:TPP-dependent pyruvate/acetoin dehydrogenase alpha subunit
MSSGLFRPSKNAYPDMTMTTNPAAGATSTKEEEAAAQEEESYTKNTLLRAHRQMIRLRKMDTILHNAQRQGRISFYMTHHGEEAIHMGSASALSSHDTIFAQYREAGLLMWRGFTLDQFCCCYYLWRDREGEEIQDLLSC